MIANRTQGLRILCHSFVVAYMLVLFSLMLAGSIYFLQRINTELVNLPLYYLGVFLAGILSYNYRPGELTELSPFRWVSSIRRANYQVIILALILFAIVFSTKDKAISRLFIGSFLLTFWVTAIPLNRLIPDIISRLAFRGNNSMRTVFLGSAKSANRLEEWARRQPFLGVEVLGLVTYEMATDHELAMPVIGEFIELSQIISERKVDQVVLLETRNSDWWVDTVLDVCRRAGCRVLIFNQWEEYFEQQLIPVHQGGHTFFALQEEPLENPINGWIKRFIDIVISLPVVVFVLPWLCLLVYGFQRVQSPGSLFFKQERSGQRGERFKIYKFRSMHDRKEDLKREGEQATVGDDRIFPFGEFMRKTSLDEFPQFINVLRGQMSVVGPRPHLIKHDDEFAAHVDVYKGRHFVKPGITGLAQCKGFRGEVTEMHLIEERVRYDVDYIRRWSIWLDLWILLKTFVQIFKPPKTAY